MLIYICSGKEDVVRKMGFLERGAGIHLSQEKFRKTFEENLFELPGIGKESRTVDGIGKLGRLIRKFHSKIRDKPEIVYGFKIYCIGIGKMGIQILFTSDARR